MESEEPCRFLAWDSEFFGRRIARVTVPHVDEDLVKRILDWGRTHDIECLYFLAQGDAATVRAIETHGFHLVDVRVTLEQLIGTLSDPPTNFVRPVCAADINALRAIARVSHRDSRFYHDDEFPRGRCDALYETWIENSCRGWADAVLVAECDDHPAGYVSCHRRLPDLGQIGLFAVAETFRGRGVGRALVRAALHWFAGAGLRTVTVVTQGRNADAQRLYQRCGFFTRSVELWYHRWSPGARTNRT